MPPGVDVQGVGALCRLLPYIEQDNQFRLFSFKPAPEGNPVVNGPTTWSYWFRDPQNRPAITNTPTVPRPPARYGSEGNIKTLLCPSADLVDPSSTAVQMINAGTAGTDYNAAFGGSGSFWFTGLPGNAIMGRTNYLASAGDWRLRPTPANPTVNSLDCHGLFYYKSAESLGRVPDGTSTTVLFAENAGGFVDVTGVDPLIGRKWTLQAWAYGIWYQAYGICPNGNYPNAPAQNCNPASRSRSVFAAGSMHGGNVCNMAFADGSVKAVNAQTIDRFALSFITGGKDGQVQGTDF